jgi:hypothetical protein
MEDFMQIAMTAAGDFAPWTCFNCESQNDATTKTCEVCNCPKFGVIQPMTDAELWDMYNYDGSFHKYDAECKCDSCDLFR